MRLCHNYLVKKLIGSLPTPTTYTRLLLQRLPAQAAALLADTGLSPDTVLAAPAMTVTQQLQVFRNVKAMAGQSDWALAFGRELNIASHGPLGFAALSAPTLGEGLDVLARYARIRGPNFFFHMRPEGERMLFVVDTSQWPQEDLAPWLVEIVMQIIAAYFEAVIGSRVADATVMFSAPPPPHADLYARHFRARCEFDAPLNAFAIDANLLAMPCPLHDEQSYRASLIRCRAAYDALLERDALVERVRQVLASHYDRMRGGGDSDGGIAIAPQAQDVASQLCMSPRTLARQLAAQGASFRELLEEQQRDAASTLLAQARYTVTDVAALLGYSDVTNFDRAFRRMFGVSPNQYRRGLAGKTA